jgi:hypothetical protein
MSNLSKRMLFTYLLSEINVSKYKQKELQKKVKLIYYNIFKKKKEEEMRIYEVEIQVVKSEIYHVKAKDDADLIEKNKGGLIEEEGKLIRTDEAENIIGGWKQIKNKK